MKKPPYVNTPSKRERQSIPSPLDYDDDGYLHFQRRDHYDTLRTSNEEKANDYSYINPDKLDKPVARARPSPVNLEQNSGRNRKTQTHSRKCYFVAVVVVICAVAATAIAVYYIMKNKQDKCTCQCEGQTGTNTSNTTTMVSGSTAPFTTSEKSTTSQPTSTTITPVQTTSFDIAKRCLYPSSNIIPHPYECQAYYNCSKVIPTIQDLQHYEECTYPELFNVDTLSCDHFENVECGERKEAKSGCDYRYTNCIRSQCMPCFVGYPSCEGMNDDRNVYQTREWSSTYIVCYNERFITFGNCQKDYRSMQQMFSPVANACVSLDRMPRQYGGIAPNCTSKAYGTYPDEDGICDRYIICGGGNYIDYVDCPDGQAFDETSKKCSSSPYTCVCGGGTDC